MVDKTPLKFEFNSTTPSSLAEFTSSDTVPLANGGTGTSSLTNFGVSLSATNVSAASVSSTTISSPTITGGAITGASVSSTTLTSPTIIGASVSSTAVSGLTVNGMPYPPPFAYMQMNADGTSTTASSLVGAGGTNASINSDSTAMSWDNTNMYFHVSADGTYECLGTITFEGGATLVLITLVKNESPVLSVTPRVHSTVDPVERTVRAIFTAESGDSIGIYHDSQSGNAVKAITGTTMSLRRLL